MKLQLSLLIISFSQLAKAQTPGKSCVTGADCGLNEACLLNGDVLQCVLTGGPGQTIPGKIAQLGEVCEGNTPEENFARCAPGLTCVFPPEVTQIPDLSGVCQAITTSTVTPTQTSTVVYPPNQTSTVRPTQTSAVVYPTDAVVGAASGITAFGFAGIIALFL